MILTSNRGFAEWGEVFGDPVVATALLDRLLHHAVVIQIEGASYRLRQHADLIPEHIRSKAIIQPPPLTARGAADAAQRTEPPITVHEQAIGPGEVPAHVRGDRLEWSRPGRSSCPRWPGRAGCPGGHRSRPGGTGNLKTTARDRTRARPAPRLLWSGQPTGGCL